MGRTQSDEGLNEQLPGIALHSEPAHRALPLLALVGRPNVGKSTLFNRLTRSREALVAPVPGVTRDRREAIFQRSGMHFRLVDTGGVPFDKAAVFGAEVEDQIQKALADAALIWVIVDAAEGLNPYDAELARRVQTSGRPWLLIANKAEGPERLGRVGEFHRLGAPEVIPLSALNGHGIDAALEASAVLVPQLRKGANSEPGEASPIRVAFVGRPNVGKSSLLNAILGERRFIVSEIAGTTREAVDIHVTVEGERFSLVDTAGLRRKARTTEYLDKLSAVNTLQALDRAEVAVLVLDASAGPVDQDARIAGHILERHRACVVALNKWDLVAGASKQGLGGLSGGAAHSSGSPRYGDRTPQDVQADIEHSLRFLGLAELVRVSALRGTGLRHLFRAIRTAHRHYTRMISTADLNRVVQIITRHTPPPARGRAPTKVHYGVQTGTRPPSFRLFTNHPEQVRAEYSLFMEHQLRYHFGLSGTPLKIEWSGRESSSEEVTPPRVQARRPKPAAERSKRNAGRTGRASAKSARKPQRGRSGSRPPKAGKKPLRRSKKR